jgi:hypothetical protein
MSYDPPVILHKSVLMQRIADHMRYGYRHWTCGIVSLHKATTFVRKFSSLYIVHAGKDERYRRKRLGLGCAVLLLWQPDPDGPLHWYLLVTEGDHPAHILEKLRDGGHDRVQCTGYELAQLTKPGRERPVISWRMSKQTYDAWRERIINAVRSPTEVPARQAWYSLYHSPGFFGIRSNVGKLVALLRAEWRRSRSEPFPFCQARLHYLQRLKTTCRPLSAVLRGINARRSELPQQAAPQ